MEPIHHVNDAIYDAGEAVDKLAEAIRRLADHDEPADLEAVVLAAVHLRAVMNHARDARDILAEYAHHLMPAPVVPIPGVGPVQRTGGWDRKDWEHDELLRKVVRWAKDDREAYAREHDGEAPPESEGETVARLIREYAGIAYWKVTGPRERGLNVDDYCRKEPARKGISLPRQEE